MARDYARIFTRIWSDADFIALPASAQRTYLMLVSQPSMNYAGVLDLTVGRWSRFAPDTNAAQLRNTIHDLEEARFVVVDYDTEELLVRSYMAVDEIHKQARVTRVAVREALSVQSPRIRAQLAASLAILPPVPVPEKSASRAAEAHDVRAEVAAAIHLLNRSAPTQATLGATVDESMPATLDPTPAATLGGGVAEHASATPAATLGPTHTRAPASGSGSGYGSGSGPVAVAEGKLSKTQDQNAAQVDAGEPSLAVQGRMVAGGRYLDDGTLVGPARVISGDGSVYVDDGKPVGATAEVAELEAEARAQLHDGYAAADTVAELEAARADAERSRAMPADHCGNHRERNDSCGRCAAAAEDQRRWIAERDDVVAKARATAQAELAAEQARPEPEREVVAPKSGRAEFLAAQAELAAKRERLAEIERLLAGRGITSPSGQMAAVRSIVDTQAGSLRDLTRAEVRTVLDHLVAVPPLDEPPQAGDDGGDAPGDDERATAPFPAGETATYPARSGDPLDDGLLPPADDFAPDPVEHDDGSEDEPPGDDAAEDEYRRDLASWRDDDETEPVRVLTPGVPDDEPPF